MIMDAVFYYSNSGESRRIAEFMAKECGFPIFDITDSNFIVPPCRLAISVFPVYCQAMPPAVKKFLKNLSADRHILMATYGKMSFGNVLYDAQKCLDTPVVAAAYLPTAHTYRTTDTPFSNFDALLPILQIAKSKHAPPIVIPKYPKNPLASVLPAWRSRMGLYLLKKSSCTKCNLCAAVCPLHAIEYGKPNRRCIRCLRCVKACPQKALYTCQSLFLRLYLKREKEAPLYIFPQSERLAPSFRGKALTNIGK